MFVKTLLQLQLHYVIFSQDRLDAQDDKLDKLMNAIHQLAQKESRDSKEPSLLESMFDLNMATT